MQEFCLYPHRSGHNGVQWLTRKRDDHPGQHTHRYFTIEYRLWVSLDKYGQRSLGTNKIDPERRTVVNYKWAYAADSGSADKRIDAAFQLGTPDRCCAGKDVKLLVLFCPLSNFGDGRLSTLGQACYVNKVGDISEVNVADLIEPNKAKGFVEGSQCFGVRFLLFVNLSGKNFHEGVNALCWHVESFKRLKAGVEFYRGD